MSIIENCIIWNNTAPEIVGGGSVLSFSCIKGGWPGIGNIDAVPLFVDPNGADGIIGTDDDNLRPHADSPCINIGDPNYIAEPNETDLDGRPRVLDGRIDMGAYEFNYIPIADAGPDQTVYAWFDGIAKVILDGTGSYDDDGQSLTYFWSWTVDGNSFTASGPSPIIELPVGEHIIELTVNDGADDSEPNEVMITVIPPIEATLKLTPQALNLDSQGKWVKAHFTLPEGFSVDDIDVNTPATMEPLGIESEYINVFINEDGLVVVTITFSRSAVCGSGLDHGFYEIAIVGMFTSGQYFYGIDTVRIIDKSLEYVALLSFHWLDSDCGKPDWCDGADLDQDSEVKFIDFAMFDSCCIEVYSE